MLILNSNMSLSNFHVQLESVTFDEFCDYAGQERDIDENLLLRAFEQVDPNGDGFIERDELERVVLKVAKSLQFKVDNLVQLLLLYLSFWINLSHSLVFTILGNIN